MNQKDYDKNFDKPPWLMYAIGATLLIAAGLATTNLMCGSYEYFSKSKQTQVDTMKVDTARTMTPQETYKK